jgi:tRNA(Arg) A34 adenosine deaminase TadA
MNELDDELYMRRAIELVANSPALPFAAVVVDRRNGTIVAEGWNRAEENPVLHGEVSALNALTQLSPRPDGRHLVLYTTAEPCPMCMGAVLWSGIGRVVFGTSIRFLLDTGWRQIDISAAEVANRAVGMKCEVVGGVLADDCNSLFLSVCRAAPGW